MFLFQMRACLEEICFSASCHPPYCTLHALFDYLQKLFTNCQLVNVHVFLDLQWTMSSKSRRRVTVDRDKSLPDTPEKKKPSVFDRLGPGISRHSHQDVCIKEKLIFFQFTCLSNI